MLTHIFLADQVWDPAVEHQVVSRAYRMGATGRVTVAQLLMKSTLEETLHQMVTRADGQPATANAAAAGVAALAAADTCGVCEEEDAPEAPAGRQGGSAGGSSGGGGHSDGAARDAPETPKASISAKAAGKRRAGDAPHPEDRTPGAKRARRPDAEDEMAESERADAAAPSPPPPAAPASNSTAAQEEAKVHSLLKSIRFLRD